MRRFLCAVPILFVFLIQSARADDEARLLRFPAIHGDQIVFTYAGNLYTVSAKGGVARRMTSHEGFEMFARFSPDGKWLAFTGQYDGNTEVYLMPAEGGAPKRLTYTATLNRDDVSDRMGPNNIVIGWTPDGKNILFRSRMNSFNDFIGQLFTVPMDGGMPEALPVPRGGFASYSPDSEKLAYNRIFREFRTWKRYRGGMCDDIWIYDFKTKKTENITNNEASDIIPMWHGDRIYFLSDRDERKRMNLYVYDLKAKNTSKVTDFKEFDIKFPSLGDQAIVFENGGYIFKLDLTNQKFDKVPVRILEDDAGSRGGVRNVSKFIASYEIAPDGARALFSARGDIFTVPAKHGPTRNLTNSPGVHDRNPKWSPDGKSIAFISDMTGEDEIHVIGSNPSDMGDKPEATKQITTQGDCYKYDIFWSPDSKKILWSDRKQRLLFVDVESKKVTSVVESRAFEIRDYAWSPDSKWIAYVEPNTGVLNRLNIYSLEKAQTYQVTDGWYSVSSPEFSADGKYLFFASSRDFNPLYSRTEWNHSYSDMERIYLVTLAKDTRNPFAPRSDEVGEKPSGDTDKKDGPDKKDGADKKEPVSVKVDIEGLGDRVVSLPGQQAASYRHLVSTGAGLYYLRTGPKDAQTQIFFYDLAQQKETSIGNAGGFEISHDQKKMLINRDDKYAILELPKASVASLSDPLNLSGMEARIDHAAEWRDIFNECWRQMRDFFYNPEMNGVDWVAVRKKYEPLVAHVQHRADLTYIIGEMIGELNCSHTYVGGGDMPHPQRVPMGLLGADLKRDAKSGYFQIGHILKGADWDSGLRSPLTEIGVNLKEGDYILAVNGRSTAEVKNIYELLINTVGNQVTLKVNGAAEAKGARNVVVVPIGDEAHLRYYNWVEDNIHKVSEASNGKVGYLHVPDMQQNGLNEFIKHYYPQLTKKGLIIDVRGNGGGNVSPMLIERLRRDIDMVSIARNTSPTVDPNGTFYGPMLCLLNEYSASDGDLFPYRFRYYKLGQLVGKRSWGGVVGIRGSLPLLDGGYLNKPEFSRYDVEGKNWIIEGHGVDPDVVVDNDPAREFAGDDQQLDKAIESMLDQLKKKEKVLPPPPDYPKK